MFNVWTFLLELVNFLVLVWILKRLLYGPIVEVINRRRQMIRGQMEEIEARQAALGQEKQRIEEQLANLARERERTVAEARSAAEEERRKILAEAGEQARQAAERLRAAVEAERQDAARDLQGRLIDEAVWVSGEILASVAAASLDDALVAAALRELDAVTPERARGLTAAAAGPQARVVSAHALTPDRRQAAEQRLRRLLGEGAAIEFGQDAALRAGVRIELGELVLEATLAAQIEALRRQAAARLEAAPAGAGESA